MCRSIPIIRSNNENEPNVFIQSTWSQQEIWYSVLNWQYFQYDIEKHGQRVIHVNEATKNWTTTILFEVGQVHAYTRVSFIGCRKNLGQYLYEMRFYSIK